VRPDSGAAAGSATGKYFSAANQTYRACRAGEGQGQGLGVMVHAVLKVSMIIWSSPKNLVNPSRSNHYKARSVEHRPKARTSPSHDRHTARTDTQAPWLRIRLAGDLPELRT
jgi:hypothetical protein